MDFVLIAKAVGALSVIGLGTSAVLATAAKRFHVEVDPRVEEVAALLPGSNCGACGNPSCFAVAEGIVAGTLPTNSCIAGGQKTASGIAEIMGTSAGDVVAIVSGRHCGGGINCARSYGYAGVRSCNAANRLAGGPVACTFGCIGFGDCMRACPFDAIHMDERGLPVVDLDKCTGCGICVRECPRGQISLLAMLPEKAPVIVRCNAHDKVKARKANCGMACIACKKCERACPSDAIHVIDMLAVVDYDKCTGCGACVEVCPQHCINLYGRDNDSMAEDGAGGVCAAETLEAGA